MIGVVPAAGEGTRLRPLTESKPKGLVSVAGRPLLEHVFETLLDSGVDGLVVVVGYRAGDIINHFGESFEGCPITYVHQRERSGLGHAIRLAEPHVDDSFVVLNGDNVVDGTLDRPIQRFEESDSDAAIAVEEAEPERARETGVVTVDGKRVTSIVEKPDEPSSTLVTTGCYVLSLRVFGALGLIEPSPRGEYELADALGVLIRAGRLIEAVELDTDRVNVNTAADIEHADDLLSR